MANNLEINDSAPKGPELPAGQLSQECWSIDKGATLKSSGGSQDGVLDFGKHDIYNLGSGKESTVDTGSGNDLKFPKGYDIDPGFAPKSGDHHIKIDGKDIVLPANQDTDPGFAPKPGDRHFKVSGVDVALPAGYDIDPGFNPGGKDNQPGRGDGVGLLPSAADGTLPEKLGPNVVSGGAFDGLKIPADSSPATPSHDQVKGAEAKVDSRAHANHEQLSPEQQDARKRLDHAILEGDQKQVESLMRRYKNYPEALEKIMGAVSNDLGPAGVHVSFNVGNMMIGEDKDSHQVGMLNISRDGAGTDVEFSTDARLKTTVGSRGIALIANPSSAMQDIADYAVEHTNK